MTQESISWKAPSKNFKIKIPPILSKPLDTERVEGRDEEGRIIGEFDNLNQAVLLKSVLKHNNLSVLPIGKKFIDSKLWERL